MTDLKKVVERHVMVDIETLGTGPNAFITSIGAVEFFPGSCQPRETRFYRFDPWTDQRGATVDGKTVEWRQKQCEESKVDLRKPVSEYAVLDVALIGLKTFIGESTVWANSPEFDLTILNSAARRLGLDPVSQFWKHRDVRTAKMALEMVTGEEIKYENTHHPLDDCRNQIHYVVEPFLEVLNERRTTRSGTGEGGPSGSESSSNKVSESVNAD